MISPEKNIINSSVNIKINQQPNVLCRDVIIYDVSFYAYSQRTGLCDVGGFEKRPTVTAAD